MEAVGPRVLVQPQDPFHGALDRGPCLGSLVAEEYCRRILGVPAGPDEVHAAAEARSV